MTSPTFVAAIALGGTYIVLSIASLIATVTNLKVFRGLRSHRLVTDALSPKTEAPVLISEAVATTLLWIGLNDLQENINKRDYNKNKRYYNPDKHYHDENDNHN